VKKFLEISNVSKLYPAPGGGESVIVKDFDLWLHAGEFVSIIGHSGCGKSTVLSMVAGLAEVSAGGIILAGREVTGPGPDRGVVFQSPCLFAWRTALENVQIGLDAASPSTPRAGRAQVARHYLDLVGLGHAVHKRPHELSLGMRQRVGLARAFALSPKLLLLDEPFGMLDMLTRYELQEVLLSLWLEDRKTALMVTHDVDEALFLSDRIVLMTNGPAATVGEILDVPFERPRRRAELVDRPDYETLRQRILTFLEEQDRHAADPSPTRSGNGREILEATVL
jgi:nitrate/nitrite transport system ATP-binding protein